MQDGEAQAKLILKKKRDELHIIAKALLEFETLSGEDVNTLIKGGVINRDDKPPKRSDRSGTSVPRAGAKRGRSGGMEPEPQPQ